jgi:hypothetical protein
LLVVAAVAAVVALAVQAVGCMAFRSSVILDHQQHVLPLTVDPFIAQHHDGLPSQVYPGNNDRGEEQRVAVVPNGPESPDDQGLDQGRAGYQGPPRHRL